MTVEPFGLSFIQPLQPHVRLSCAMSTAEPDRRHTAVINGRPLCELAAEDLMVESQPTEKDGKDPINVDSDPFYD